MLSVEGESLFFCAFVLFVLFLFNSFYLFIYFYHALASGCWRFAPPSHRNCVLCFAVLCCAVVLCVLCCAVLRCTLSALCFDVLCCCAMLSGLEWADPSDIKPAVISDLLRVHEYDYLLHIQARLKLPSHTSLTTLSDHCFGLVWSGLNWFETFQLRC